MPALPSFRPVLASVFALSTAVVPALAHASPLELYGASARSAAMGGAVSTDADGVDALFVNPAALAGVSPMVSVGFVVGLDQASIALKERPAGYDIPNLGNVTPTVPSGATLNARGDTDKIGPIYLVSLGAVSSLGSRRFRAGASVTLPLGAGPTDTHYADERERLFSNRLHWELLDQRVRRFDIEFGAAYSIIPRLSIGLGGTMLPSVNLSNDVYLRSATDQEDVDINLAQTTGWGWGFGAGILWEITDAVRLAAAYRHEVAFDIEGRNEIQIRGLEGQEDYPIVQSLLWRPASSPPSATLAGSVDIARVRLNLESSWTRWSRFIDSHGAETNFNDTISMRLGTEYTWSERTQMRAGVAYSPTPIPEQTGRTNYVDNTRVTGSLGAAHRFEIVGRTIEVGWFVQMHFLVPRDTDKEEQVAWASCVDGETQLCDEVPDTLVDPRTGQPVEGTAGLQTGNPGFPGFASGGWIGAIGADLRWLF